MHRLRALGQLALVLTLAVSTQGLLLAQAAWLVNQEWIAATLCINPGTDCGGVCQLSERMEEMTDREKSKDDPAVLLEIALTMQMRVEERADVPGRSAGATTTPWQSAVATDTGRLAPHRVFHPPRPADLS